MNKLTGLTLTVFCATIFGGCGAASNAVNTTNKTNVNTNTSNVAVVVNNNSAAVTNTGNTNSVNYNVSRADYDKDRTKYEAEKGTSTIGQGANDSYIWFKTKGELATVDGLRDSTINVDVTNDVITLKGTVATAAQREAAEKAAKSIEGQKGVKNDLKVDAKDSMTNQMVNGNTSSNMSNSKMSNSAMNK